MRAGAASRPAAVTVAVLLAVPLASCGGGREDFSSAQPVRPIVLVSGRDDHGLLVTPTVGISDKPNHSGSPRGRVPDGTLVAVVGWRGEWIRIRTLEGRSLAGWVNDFYLRGTAHLASSCPVAASEMPGADVAFEFPASAQVELLELRWDGRRAWVRVRLVQKQDEAWVERNAIAELPARGRCPAP